MGSGAWGVECDGGNGLIVRARVGEGGKKEVAADSFELRLLSKIPNRGSLVSFLV